MTQTAIEWTDKVWNPIAGCSVVSPGCTNCYAMRMAARIQRMGGTAAKKYAGTTMDSKAGAVWTGRINFDTEALRAPFGWKKPARVFVNSMADLFHDDVTDEQIDKVFAVMALNPRHTFQVLTKRAKRMRAYMLERWQGTPAQTICGIHVPAGGPTGRMVRVEEACQPYLDRYKLVDPDDDALWTDDSNCKAMQWGWPLPNVWLGVSVEDQRRADERIPDLLATPAAVRWISAEPLLGPLDLSAIKIPLHGESFQIINALHHKDSLNLGREQPAIDWVVAGGESGPGARPCHPDWVRTLRDQCASTNVAFFFKQWGRWRPLIAADTRRDWLIVYANGERDIPDDRSPDESAGECAMLPCGKRGAGAELDGREHREWPA